MKNKILKLAAIIALSAATGLLSGSLAATATKHQPRLQPSAGVVTPSDIEAGRRQSNGDDSPIDGWKSWAG